jgi:hypothetical protein
MPDGETILRIPVLLAFVSRHQHWLFRVPVPRLTPALA